MSGNGKGVRAWWDYFTHSIFTLMKVKEEGTKFTHLSTKKIAGTNDNEY